MFDDADRPRTAHPQDDVKRLAAAGRKQQKRRVLSLPAQLPHKATVEPQEPVETDLRGDLWKYALLIMFMRSEGKISTSEMISEMPGYVYLLEEHIAANASRKNSKFSQLVRNLKSHKTTKTNFIYQGYVHDVSGGFQITTKGMDFVREYFKN